MRIARQEVKIHQSCSKGFLSQLDLVYNVIVLCNSNNYSLHLLNFNCYFSFFHASLNCFRKEIISVKKKNKQTKDGFHD